MSPEFTDFESIGVVLAADGEVFLRSDSGMRRIESGAEVFRGEELVTGVGSSAEIRFSDDTLLSQGADSIIALDDYVFDSSGGEASELLFKMTQGTFRMVTGQIAEQNPERFKVGTPLATIGIRGTTTVHEIIPGGGEKHGVEEIHAGKALLVQSIDGEIRMISSPRALVDIAMSGLMSTVRPMTVQEFNSFREIAPSAIQQEQEIQRQHEEEERDDLQDRNDVQDDDQQDDGTGEQADNGEGQQEGGQQGEGLEGGETGGLMGGEGVLEAGVGVFIENALGDNTQFNPEILAAAMDVAEDVFANMSAGDLQQVSELLNKLNDITDPTELDDLLDEADVPKALEGHTYTSSDGINWIYGTSGDDTWVGTSGVDYYDGLGGNDTISGMQGNDVLRGGTGNDYMFGNCDNDSIDGGEGNDTISGGAGKDVIDGGAGVDILSFEDYTQGVDAYIGEGTAVTTVEGSEEEDVFTNIEGLKGSSYDDILSGSDDSNTFIGSGGSDMISGLGGENWISYQDGDSGVSICLDSGTVMKFGSYDHEYMGYEYDYIHDINHARGTAYDDTIYGNSSVNTLMGGDGNDRLYGYAGADILTGGAGADDFYYTTTAPSEFGDTITDFESGVDVFKFESYGGFSTDAFQSVANYADAGAGATSTGTFFVFDSVNDKLFYDTDVTDSDPGQLVALVEGDDMSAGDVELVI